MFFLPSDKIEDGKIRGTIFYNSKISKSQDLILNISVLDFKHFKVFYSKYLNYQKLVSIVKLRLKTDGLIYLINGSN